jgi:hypothetical protein
MRADGHNHFSYISSIGSPDERFSGRLLDFVLKQRVRLVRGGSLSTSGAARGRYSAPA